MTCGRDGRKARSPSIVASESRGLIVIDQGFEIPKFDGSPSGRDSR